MHGCKPVQTSQIIVGHTKGAVSVNIFPDVLVRLLKVYLAVKAKGEAK